MKQPIWLLLFLLPLTSARAEPGRVRDLGEIEIQGEVRKPLIQYLDREPSLEEGLSRLVRDEAISFEAQLLDFNDLNKKRDKP